MKKVLNRCISAVLALLLVLTMLPSGEVSIRAAVKNPTMKKSASVNLKSSVTLKVSKNGWTVKKVTAKSSKPKIATVKVSKKMVKVTGKKAGNTTIISKVTAMKGKKTKAFTFKTKVTVKKSGQIVVVEKAVATIDELLAALSDGKANKLTLSTDEKSDIEIPEGIYSSVDLIINAPNASITNNATFKSITINAIAMNTWHEKGKKNSIVVDSPDPVRVIIDTIDKLLGLFFRGESSSSSTANVVQIVNGTIDTIGIETEDKVNISAETGTKVGDVNVSGAADVNLTASGTAEVENVSVTANGADVDVTANGSAEIATVKVEGDASISVSGSSDKTTTVDIKDAGDGAKVTVNTSTVKIETSEGTKTDAIVSNNSGRSLITDVYNNDGTVRTTTTESTSGGSYSGAGSVPAVIGGGLTPVSIISEEEQRMNALILKINDYAFKVPNVSKEIKERYIGDIVNSMQNELDVHYDTQIGAEYQGKDQVNIVIKYIENNIVKYTRSVTVPYTLEDATLGEKLKEAIVYKLLYTDDAHTTHRSNVMSGSLTLPGKVTVDSAEYSVTWTSEFGGDINGLNQSVIDGMVTKTGSTGQNQTFTFNPPETDDTYTIIFKGSISYTEGGETKTAEDATGFFIKGTGAPVRITQLWILQQHDTQSFASGVATSAVKDAFKDYVLSGGAGADGGAYDNIPVGTIELYTASHPSDNSSAYQADTKIEDDTGTLSAEGTYFARLYPNYAAYTTAKLETQNGGQGYVDVAFLVTSAHKLTLQWGGQNSEYTVTITDADGNNPESISVTEMKNVYVKEGYKVTLSVGDGYKIDLSENSVTYKEASDSTATNVNVEENSETGAYTFTMPAYDTIVNIAVTASSGTGD